MAMGAARPGTWKVITVVPVAISDGSCRRCRAIEISPPFVDVAVKRWQTATGKQATLDGQTFDEVEAARKNQR